MSVSIHHLVRCRVFIRVGILFYFSYDKNKLLFIFLVIFITHGTKIVNIRRNNDTQKTFIPKQKKKNYASNVFTKKLSSTFSPLPPKKLTRWLKSFLVCLTKKKNLFTAYGEVVATLERLQIQLRNLSSSLGISGQGVEGEVEAVSTLLKQKRFALALATHHAIKARLRSGKSLKLHTDDASSLARDVSLPEIVDWLVCYFEVITRAKKKLFELDCRH